MSTIATPIKTISVASVANMLHELGGRRTGLNDRIHTQQLEIATLKGLDNGQPASDAVTRRERLVHTASKASNEALDHWKQARAHLNVPVDLSAATMSAENAANLLNHVEQQLDLADTGAMESTPSAEPKVETSSTPAAPPATSQHASSQAAAKPQATPQPSKPDTSQPASAEPAKADLVGLEQRLTGVVENGLKAVADNLRSQLTASTGLPEGFAEVLADYDPEDLRVLLKSSHWLNSKRRPKKATPGESPLEEPSSEESSHDDSENIPNK